MTLRRLCLTLSAVTCMAFDAALLSSGASAQEAGAYIAGTQPSARAANAPTLKDHAKPATWRADALKGVVEPYPPSLKFLDDQGGWFNPFMHAGMTGPYDIRGWHTSAASASSPK